MSIVLYKTLHQKYRVEMLLRFISAATPNPFLRIRMTGTMQQLHAYIHEHMAVVAAQSQPAVAQPITNQLLNADEDEDNIRHIQQHQRHDQHNQHNRHIPYIRLHTSAFLPQNFATHTENVMTATVIKSLRETIDFLICEVDHTITIDTLSEIRDAFASASRCGAATQWIPGIVLTFVYVSMYELYIYGVINAIPVGLLCLFATSVYSIATGTNRIQTHMRDMCERENTAYYTEHGIDVSYKELLDLVWKYIRKHKDREELVGRLKQEIFDSLHVCYHGNMVRLANVLQGFEPQLHPPVSGEIIQFTIARVANSDDTTDEKIRIATELLIDFGLEEGARNEWLVAIHAHET
jgi:hypothetical protein